MRLRLKHYWIAVLIIMPATALFLFAQQQATPAAKSGATSSAQSKKSAKPKKHLGGAGFSAFPHAPAAPAAEVARGKRIFQANCSFCHGPDAMGGEGGGPELLVTKVLMEDRNGDILTPIVHHGFPPRMPSFSSLSGSDIRAIAAYLHSLPVTNRGQRTKLNIVVGNAQAGEAYFKQNCTTCHTTTGNGPGSLAGIGSEYSPRVIQDFIVSGGEGRLPPNVSKPTIPPTTVTVTLASGKTVKGKLDNLSPFVVSLTEADGTRLSFPRNGSVPKVVVHDPLMWHIDMLAKWKDTNIHNLTAYLVTLK